jgi:hypothetical protein
VVIHLGRSLDPVPYLYSHGSDREGIAVMQYISQPMFWVSVVLVALAVNWAWKQFFQGKGKLV